MADLWSPDRIQQPSVALAGGEGHVVHGHAHLAVGKIGVEDLAAGWERGRGGPCLGKIVPQAVVGELLDERKGPRLDPQLDGFELDSCSAEVGCGRRAPDGRAIAFALVLEGEFDAVPAFRLDAAGFRLSTHRW